MREKVMRVRRIASCKLSLVLTCAGSNHHLGWAWTVSTTIRFTYIPLNVSTWTWLWNKTTRNSFVISQLLLHNVNGIWLDPLFVVNRAKWKKSDATKSPHSLSRQLRTYLSEPGFQRALSRMQREEQENWV